MGANELVVLDPELRMHGAGGLWIARASIMATLIGGNTNGPTIAIVEKAADMIRADAGMAVAAE